MLDSSCEKMVTMVSTFVFAGKVQFNLSLNTVACDDVLHRGRETFCSKRERL